MTKIKSLRLKSDLVEKIEAKASSENRNFNNMVETILIRYIKEHDPSWVLNEGI